jgi:hypothetical protein
MATFEFMGETYLVGITVEAETEELARTLANMFLRLNDDALDWDYATCGIIKDQPNDSE